jgi:phosphate:Na+ symporter
LSVITDSSPSMNYGIFELLSLLGALGFFIYGMKVMSEGIQKAAGSGMRKILRTMTSNRFKGVFTGFFITSVVQSSSATTVLVVSFVNAGLLSLVEAIGVIMGANIGTTVTAWLISIVGFKVNIAAYALPIIAFGFPLMFFNRERLKFWGEVLVGFALLFMGLAFLKDSVPDIKSNPEILEFLQHYTDLGFFSILIFVGIGTILTITVQSSSAAMALTLVMANYGWIPFELAAAMVLGENIGTTITANLAAIIANVHAKRAAFAHFIFNIIGVIWMMALIYPVLGLVNKYVLWTGSASPYASAEAVPMALAVFHTSFNVVNMLLLVGFVKLIAKQVSKVIKGDGDTEYRLEYISTGLMNTAELALEEARKEVVRFGQVTSDMSKDFRKLLVAERPGAQKKLMSKIRQAEDLTDRMEEEITEYLLAVSSDGTLSSDGTRKVTSLMSVINDLERIGDLMYQLSRDVERQHKQEIRFKPKQVKNLLHMMDLVDAAFEVMMKNLNASPGDVNLDEALKCERAIDKFRNKLRKEQNKVIEKDKFNPKRDSLYKDMFHIAEKIGDHIINVSEGITGERERIIRLEEEEQTA